MRIINIFAAEIQGVEPPKNCQTTPEGKTECLTHLPEVAASSTQLTKILTVFFGVIAAVAVITILIAAFNYATSGDDPEKISRSKRTIIFSLLGLAIAVMAEVIVLTIVGKL